jgi:hypothetical protein
MKCESRDGGSLTISSTSDDIPHALVELGKLVRDHDDVCDELGMPRWNTFVITIDRDE